MSSVGSLFLACKAVNDLEESIARKVCGRWVLM